MSIPQPQDPTLSMPDADGPPATVAEEGKATTYAHLTHASHTHHRPIGHAARPPTHTS